MLIIHKMLNVSVEREADTCTHTFVHVASHDVICMALY